MHCWSVVRWIDRKYLEETKTRLSLLVISGGGTRRDWQSRSVEEDDDRL